MLEGLIYFTRKCQYFWTYSNLCDFSIEQKSISPGEDDVEWYMETILTKSIVSANPHLRQVIYCHC